MIAVSASLLFVFIFWSAGSSQPISPTGLNARVECACDGTSSGPGRVVQAGAKRKDDFSMSRIGSAVDVGCCIDKADRMPYIEGLSLKGMSSFEELYGYLETIVYLPKVQNLNGIKRVVLIDAGAREPESSIEGFFYKHYLPLFPQHLRDSAVIWAFEANPGYAARYRGYSRVSNFFPNAVWVRNETLTWSSGVVSGGDATDSATNDKSRPMKVSAIDFAEFLKNWVRPGDFVALKLDIEGGEHDVMPHLHKTGAIGLVDELFIECHGAFWGGLIPSVPRTACLRMYADARRAGVFAHEWF